MFTKAEETEIKKKFEHLEKVKAGKLTSKKLGFLIAKKRVAWLEKNKDSLLAKYSNLPDEEKAYRIIYYDYMKINPDHCKMVRMDKRRIKIESKNFCPYLEACKRLGLDTKILCKETGEPSIQEMCKLINPNLKFVRNYKNIRPYSDFCEEYFEIA